jgi:hypothetical protein
MSKVSSIVKIYEYNKLVSLYQENKDKPWEDWMTFYQTFDKPGKQGLVGLFSLKGNEKTKIIFKISQYINYLVQHEETVMRSLNDLAPFCPHFCKSIGRITCKVEPKYSKTGNPFEIKSKYPIEKEAMLCEYVDKSSKFYNYIRSNKIHEDVLYSTVKQVLLAITIAQKEKELTHYDLHSFNVMMKKCKKDVVFLYVLDESNQFAVATHGHYPVIIDFGFSYVKDMQDGPLWASMGHTDVGFMSDRFDWVSDPKLFLVTVSGEIKDKRKTSKSRKLRRVVRNIFNPLKIDWESGWDDLDDQSASDYVTEIMREYTEDSPLFKKYDHYCIDLLQSLIILPMEEQNYKTIGVNYQAFLSEWVKIENEISNPFYNLYILKCVVNAARFVRAGYTCKSSRTDSIQTFNRSVYKSISNVSKFCVPKGLHCEKMLCALLLLSRNIEGVMYDIVSTRMKVKESEYSKLPLKSTEQIYAAIETNLPDEYIYTENTTICIFDCINKKTDIIKLKPEHVEIVNKVHSLCKGTTIYDIYSGKSPI